MDQSSPETTKKRWMTPTAWVIPPYIGILAIVGILAYQDDKEDDRNAAEAEQVAFSASVDRAQQEYNLALFEYQTKVQQRDSCINAVANRINNRDNWLSLYDTFDDKFPNLAEVTLELREKLDINSPVLRIEDCPPVAEPPVPPAILLIEGNPLGEYGTNTTSVPD